MIDRRTALAGLATAAVITPGLLRAAVPLPRKEVLAFYYGWYGNPAHSGRWFHWRGPGNVSPEQSPSLDHPTLGQYDSHDPAIVARHAEQARSAGLTGFVSSWWGIDSFEDRSLALLLEAMHARDMRTTAYIERQKGGVAGATRELRYLVETYGNHPGMLKVGERPVFFLYLEALRGLPAAGWRQAARAVARAGLPEPLLIGDASPRETAQFAAWAPYLDGIHVYTLAPYVAGMSPAEMTRWAAATYPRWKALVGSRIWCATVIPGFDDTLVAGRPQPRPTVPRNNGATFSALWNAAIAATPDWVIVSTFNEWHEGSDIEPSTEYGSRYLAANRSFAQRFR